MFLPKYTPVPEVDNEDEPSPRMAQGPNGELLSVPSMPYEWWLDHDGSFVPMVISTNRRPPNHNDFSDRYEKQTKAEHRAAGWLPVDEFSSEVALLDEAAKRKDRSLKSGKRFSRLTNDQMLAKALSDSTGAAIEKLVAVVEKSITAKDRRP